MKNGLLVMAAVFTISVWSCAQPKPAQSSIMNRALAWAGQDQVPEGEPRKTPPAGSKAKQKPKPSPTPSPSKRKDANG